MTKLLSAVAVCVLLFGPESFAVAGTQPISAGESASPAPTAFTQTPLAIAVADVVREYGEFNDPFDCSIAGAVTPGDDVSVSCSTVANVFSPVGSYVIVPTLSGAQAALYMPVGVGSLTVTPAPLTVTANDAARVFGAPNPVFTGTIFGIRNGDPISISYSTTADQTSVSGTYAITPLAVATAAVLSNYQVTVVNGTLSVTATDIVPQAGWWWEPARPGTGFVIERQGNDFYLVGLEYNFDGTPTWASSSGTAASSLYLGPVSTFHDGQTLTGPYRPPVDNRLTLKLKLQFLDPANATLTWFSQTSTLQRFVFSGAVTPGAVQNGFWWNPAEPGRGFGIEVQGTTLFMATWLFDDAGQPAWYLTYGPMDSPLHYAGVWQRYGGGPSFTGCAQANVGHPCIAAVTNASVGPVTVSFIDPTHATMTLPEGRQIPITKYVF